jgi:energy-converting hydrogenase B subunit D
MTVLQIVALTLVGLGGWAVVATREPVRQTIMLGLDGLALTVLFFAFQAPDVALSELVVGAVALPMILLLTLAKVRGRAE